MRIRTNDPYPEAPSPEERCAHCHIRRRENFASRPHLCGDCRRAADQRYYDTRKGRSNADRKRTNRRKAETPDSPKIDCRACGRTLPRDKFWANRSRPNGAHPYCHDCAARKRKTA